MVEARRKDLSFSLCFRCLNRLDAFYDRQRKMKKETNSKFSYLKKQGTANFSSHTREMLKKREIKEEDVIKSLFSGRPIEYQSTAYRNECKIIFKGGNFEKNPLHIIVLFSDFLRIPKIVTVYNPKEGAWWKWDSSYSRRIYINEFRTCCVHPYDSKKAHNKKHHDKPYHPVYTWKSRIKDNETTNEDTQKDT